jgi:hypothetical protein
MQAAAMPTARVAEIVRPRTATAGCRTSSIDR